MNEDACVLHVWRLENNFEPVLTFLLVEVWSLVFTVVFYTSLTGPWVSRCLLSPDCPVPTSHLSIAVMEFQMHTTSGFGLGFWGFFPPVFWKILMNCNRIASPNYSPSESFHFSHQSQIDSFFSFDYYMHVCGCLHRHRHTACWVCSVVGVYMWFQGWSLYVEQPVRRLISGRGWFFLSQQLLVSEVLCLGVSPSKNLPFSH